MKKVLLIGLGGTGCQVVSQVKQMVRSAESNYGVDPTIKIRFLGFDTDSNQEGAPNLEVIRTSRDSSVNTLLRQEPNWQEWFPNHPMLLPHNMLKGAGQIRVLSRLAFSDLLRHPNAMAQLDEALRELNAEEGQEADGLKIMIVSSFAGGTGSGMFLQMPLYLRNHIQEKYPGMQVIIRGLFALPDVFMGHALSDIQKESMYANAYASLKELAAINKICLSSDPSMEQYDIRISGLFDSKKILASEKKAQRSGVLAKNPKAGRKPYDFIFFMDNVNANTNMLDGAKEVYLEEMAKVTYMQVYAPLVSTTDSREDNLIATMMVTDGEAMYGSAGSAKLLYPYQDVVRYCAYRVVGNVVSTQWRVVDDSYEKLSSDLRAKRKKDITVKIPELSSVFIEQIEKYMKEKNPHFIFLQNDLFDILTEKKGTKDHPMEVDKPVSRKELFYANVEQYIKKTYESIPVLVELGSACGYERDASESQEDVQHRVESNEISMANYYSSIDEEVTKKYVSIADSIFPEQLGNMDDDPQKNYNIRNLLEKTTDGERHAIHPLAARYLLYALQKGIKEAKASADKKAQSLKKSIESYWLEDRCKPTEAKEEWYDIVPKKARQRKAFLDTYQKESDAQLARLREYGRHQLISAVFGVLAGRIGALLKRYAKVFSSLGLVTEDMKQECEKIERKYAEDTASEFYLCASPAYLNYAFQSVSSSGNEEKNGIYDKLFADVYASAMNDIQLQAGNTAYLRVLANYDEDQRVNQSVLDMFKKEIVPYYEEDLRRNYDDVLNLNVYQALEIQAKQNAELKAAQENSKTAPSNADYDASRRELLGRVYRKAAPYLLSEDFHEPDPNIGTDDGRANLLNALYWGMSQRVREEIKSAQGDEFKYMTTDRSPVPELNDSRMYSDYELCCYRALYSVQLTEIPKFQESEDTEAQGEFYRNYTNRIRKMLLGRYGKTCEGITPHLDIRWHTHQYLPMISGAKDGLADRNAARAMWLGLFYRNIKIESKRGKKEVYALFLRPVKGKRIKEKVYEERRLLCDGSPINRLNQNYEIFKAFQQDSVTTTQMLDVLEDVLEQDARLDMGENYDFSGPRGIPLAKAMIGSTEAEAAALDLDAVDDEEVKEYLNNERFNTNALTVLSRILNHQQASDNDKQNIVEALWEIIEYFGEKMTEKRFEELLRRIFNNSPYIRKAARPNAETLVLETYFAQAMEEYDLAHKPAPRKKAAAPASSSAAPAKKPRTRKAAPADPADA